MKRSNTAKHLSSISLPHVPTVD